MRLQKQKLFQAVYGFSLILGFCHHLVPQIGVLHLRDIGVTIQNALGFIHEGLELVLVTERFFQRFMFFHLWLENLFLSVF